MEKIIVNVASYKRIDSLVKTLESIINQCDEINVALNSTEGGLPPILYHHKINLFFTDNSKGDAFKFLRLSNSDGYFLTIDDDLIYPPNYVEYLIKRCKDYNNSKVITLHGRSFSKFPINSYYKSATEKYSCLKKVKNDVKVQFGGTGVMCFHTSLMKIPIEYFRYANMADIWVGKYCFLKNIDIICLKHDEGYIKYIPQKTTIYELESKNDTLQTKVANSILNKNEDFIEEKISVESKKQKTNIIKKVFNGKERSLSLFNYDNINKNNPNHIKRQVITEVKPNNLNKKNLSSWNDRFGNVRKNF
jgi:hypothetical protein